MDENNIHIVDFETYCATCAFKDKSSNEDPCDECLSIPAREYSRKPEKWKEKEH